MIVVDMKLCLVFVETDNSFQHTRHNYSSLDTKKKPTAVHGRKGAARRLLAPAILACCSRISQHGASTKDHE